MMLPCKRFSQLLEMHKFVTIGCNDIVAILFVTGWHSVTVRGTTGTLKVSSVRVHDDAETPLTGGSLRRSCVKVLLRLRIDAPRT